MNQISVDGLISIDPSLSLICKLGSLMDHTSIFTRTWKFGHYKEVNIGNKRVDVYKSDLEGWIFSKNIDDVYLTQKEHDCGIEAAIEILCELYWNSEYKLIEYAKFELGI
jgi:hypothetical protein